jgi:transposase
MPSCLAQNNPNKTARAVSGFRFAWVYPNEATPNWLASASNRRLDREIAKRAKEEDVPARLMTIPGVGPITATAISALAPPIETFHKGRDFAAWLGLTPVQRSSGGKQKPGATSKMGERTIRRLLVIGAAALVRQTSRRAPPAG